MHSVESRMFASGMLRLPVFVWFSWCLRVSVVNSGL